MPRPKGSKNKEGHKAGGERKFAGRPPIEKLDDKTSYWLPKWLGRWLKKNPKVIEKLKDESLRQQLEELCDAATDKTNTLARDDV